MGELAPKPLPKAINEAEAARKAIHTVHPLAVKQVFSSPWRDRLKFDFSQVDLWAKARLQMLPEWLLREALHLAHTEAELPAALAQLHSAGEDLPPNLATQATACMHLLPVQKFFAPHAENRYRVRVLFDSEIFIEIDRQLVHRGQLHSLVCVEAEHEETVRHSLQVANLNGMFSSSLVLLNVSTCQAQTITLN